MIETFLLSLLLFVVVIWLFLKVRTPSYRLDRHNVIALLTLVLEGRAKVEDWTVFTAVPLRHDPLLESIRQRCLEIEAQEFTGDAGSAFLFTETGLAKIRQLLTELENHSTLKEKP